jgi:Luciferase-like monooxygenase
MRIGLMVGSDKERSRADRLSGLVADGAAAESAGFNAFWMPQVPGYLDAMTAVTLIGQATERIEIGTAVVPIQTRHPMVMAQQALTTQIACSGRFMLGIGPSHHWIVNGQLGLDYEHPAQLMRDCLDVLDASFAGPGTVGVDNGRLSPVFPLGSARTTRRTMLAPTPARFLGTRISRRTMCDFSSMVTQRMSATPWPRATSRPSSRGCAATATRVLPIWRRELSRWARTQPNGANRDVGPRSSCRHCVPRFDLRSA